MSLLSTEKIRRGYRELHHTHPRVLDSPINSSRLAARPYGWVGEHRVVMAYELGRELSSHEHVHHVDGNKLNNTPRNLRVLDGREHKREHVLVAADLHQLRLENAALKRKLARIALIARLASGRIDYDA